MICVNKSLKQLPNEYEWEDNGEKRSEHKELNKMKYNITFL